MLDDDELTATLESLGLSRENHRAVVLLPLIEVAWADGRIQRAERVRIVQIARQFGINGRSEWLSRWLDRRPSRKVFLAARTALLDLMARADHGEHPIDSLDHLIDWCMWIAEAAGGFFGLAFTIERSERDCIEQIAASLSLGPSLPDGLVEQWEQSRRRHFLAEAPTNMRRRGPRYGILDQTTAHLNISQLTTAALEHKGEEPHKGEESAHPSQKTRPTLEPIASSSSPSGANLPEVSPLAATRKMPLEEVLRVASRSHSDPGVLARGIEGVPPPVPAHLAAVSHPGPAGAISQPSIREYSSELASGRAGRKAEEDPTLPFFDDVNVGTYVEPPE